MAHLQRSLLRTATTAPLVSRACYAPAATRAFASFPPLHNAPKPTGESKQSTSGDDESALLQQIKDEIKAAMKGKQSDVVSTLRSLLSDHQYALKAGGGAVTSLASILQKAITRRKDSAQQYTDAKRPDLAEKEHSEASLIQRFLPKQMDESELKTIVEQAVSAARGQGIEAKKLLGVVMKEVRGRVGGGAEGKRLKEIVERVLGDGEADKGNKK